MNSVLIVPSLGDFLEEVLAPSVIRLFQSERRTANTYGSTLRLSLDLTAHPPIHPDGDLIVWLHYSISLKEVAPLKFLDPKDQSIYRKYPQLVEMVTSHLEQRGYRIKPGMYGLDKNIEPIRGTLDCIQWKRESDFEVSLVPSQNGQEVS